MRETKVQDVNSAVAEQAPEVQKTPKQIAKEKKQVEAYWNSMVTRKEAQARINQAIDDEQHKLRMMYIQLKTMTKVLIDKGLVTEEQLDAMSIGVAEELFGKPEDEPEDEPEDKQVASQDPTE